MLYTLPVHNIHNLADTEYPQILTALESGQIIYLPDYTFNAMHRQHLLTEQILDGKHKNISFDYQTKRLNGFNKKLLPPATMTYLKTYMQAYAEFVKSLLATIIPSYTAQLIWGRTSYRPAEIKGRVSSKCKDDTRLHIDSFPATPVQGKRILRVFTNVNPNDKPRVWNVGEPFSTVLAKFIDSIPNYNRLRARLLHWFRVTKTLRSCYDHCQLHLHNKMKLSDAYQQATAKEQIDFQAHSTWIVFTDQVSHAALSGQFLLEQTFYLPVSAMQEPNLAPLTYWQDNFKTSCWK